MEKEKPYKCEVCQKRYKNLNGLKYHKTHSPPCNPDLLVNGGGAKPPSSDLDLSYRITWAIQELVSRENVGMA